MAMMPKRVKRRKVHRGRVRGHATRGNFVHIGEFGLMAIEPGWIKARQIEAARIAGNRALAGAGRVHIRIFPDKPITGKPLEVRQGKGKGNVEYWVAQVQPGRVLYEVEGVSEQLAREAFALASAKLPIQTAFVKRSVM